PCLRQRIFTSALRLFIYSMFCVRFFFQAEDGIRDLTVTGVQTCALPIFAGALTINGMGERAGNADLCEVALALQFLYHVPVEMRSEERRVGKDGRSWYGPCPAKVSITFELLTDEHDTRRNASQALGSTTV